ncbi:CDP-alcohol phosphatidyltransferase family protein [Hamadaea sp. NPDC051192]|uniref:CDP-alcohol phosphatidyltransferase family protein n=1 Tax=Hamadaea sp. NPDC051192 TaxID=3154940 RepID=UPI00344110CA
MRRLDLPNLVTATRYPSALVFLLACAAGRPSWSAATLALLLLTYLTDLLDGFLARRTPGRDPRAGQVMDSAADSYTFVIVFTGLFVAGVVHPITLCAVIGGRAVLDLTRLVGLARGESYLRPTFYTKAKGFVYCSLSIVLYAKTVPAFAWLGRDPLPVAANTALVLATVAAVGSFLAVHRQHFLTMFAPATPSITERLEHVETQSPSRA